MIDTLDTRDLSKELEELEADLEAWLENGGTEEDFGDLGELQDYRDLKDEIGDGWDDGVLLIGKDSFEEYAEELAGDLYDIGDHWPFTCINWKEAASELEMDYYEIDFFGESYYYNHY